MISFIPLCAKLKVRKSANPGLKNFYPDTKWLHKKSNN